MKLLAVILLAVATALLAGCQLAGTLWMETYRIKGGYYDRPSQTQKAKP